MLKKSYRADAGRINPRVAHDILVSNRHRAAVGAANELPFVVRNVTKKGIGSVLTDHRRVPKRFATHEEATKEAARVAELNLKASFAAGHEHGESLSLHHGSESPHAKLGASVKNPHHDPEKAGHGANQYGPY